MNRLAAKARLAIAPEAGVVALARSGDIVTFEELVARREGWLRDLLRRLSGDRALADDLAQQTLVTAWRTLPGLRQPAAFGGWLRRIAVNTWLQHIRGGRLAEQELTDEAINLASQDGPELGGDLRIDLERALLRLKPEERLCVVLAHADGLTHAEIAETTNLPLGTVKSHVTRGSAKLRAWLQVSEANERA